MQVPPVPTSWRNRVDITAGGGRDSDTDLRTTDEYTCTSFKSGTEPSFETAGTGGAADAADWSEGTNMTRASDSSILAAGRSSPTFTGTGTDTRTTVAIAVQANHAYTYSGGFGRIPPQAGVAWI